ncbi:MAG TPA: type I-E CRISPR-associated protein Cas5/CasD [Candidatus Omnitrophota bacterium]|nr:type I-E CRISPR-associated protein Cas5/CasD [Candidatus Omnitrophota bacterium]HQO57804.1 type I-E CRISPR-associated protein Cas5/CasD [Candidatus Omnitrophota bacterium]HQQ88313.1 type I-E CRISPR-associated protein Cas5/CasD [Smithellaceae bacterium]
MKNYLLFRLYGPLCSWGDIAVGEMRPSFPHPTKSAVLGLVAAALGIKRDEDKKHVALADSYGFSVLVEDMGRPLSDYHTVQVPPGRERYASRREEVVRGQKHELKTILSTRDYRTDAIYTIALWEKKSGSCPVEEIQERLGAPVFTLYLGRKSCPLALGLQPQIVPAASLLEAFQKSQFVDLNMISGHNWPLGNKILYWEKIDSAGLAEEKKFERRDTPLSRIRWQFDIRKEYYASVP